MLSKLRIGSNIAHGKDVVMADYLQIFVHLDAGVLLELESTLLEIICRWSDAYAHDNGIRIKFLARLELDGGGLRRG